MTTKPEILFFDAAGTIIEVFPTVGEIYARTASEFGTEISSDDVNRVFWPTLTGVRADGKLPYGSDEQESRNFWRVVVSLVFEKIGSKMPADPFLETLQDRFASDAAWRLIEDVEPAMSIARDAGVRIGLLSNFDHALRPILQSLAIESWFDPLIVSCEVDCEKPEEEIFKVAAKAAGVSDPSRIAYVGDTYIDDYVGGTAAGWKVALVDRENKGDGGAANRFPSLNASVEWLLS